MLAFLTIFAAAVAGLVGLSPIASISLGTIGLTLVSALTHRNLLQEADLLGGRSLVLATLRASVVNGLIASLAAYGLGLTFRIAML